MHRFALRAAALVFLVTTSIGAAPGFDPKPWLEDLEQVRAAMIAGYANLEWAVTDRGADLPALYEETRGRIVAAKNDDEARAAFERFGRRIGDGHIAFAWKAGGAESSAPEPVSCAGLGYNAAINGAPLAAQAPGYRAIPTVQSAEFPIGMIESGGHHVGVLKIGIFEPQGFPALCEAALTALRIPRHKPCDSTCETHISRWAHNRMTMDLAAQLRALKAAGAQVLVIDITNNGGGSEWAEAAARMVTPVKLVSEQIAYPVTPGWRRFWHDQAAELRKFAQGARGAERDYLQVLAQQSDARADPSTVRCDGEALWRGEKKDCIWLTTGNAYASGLVARADPASLRGKPYAELLFTPMEYPYQEGVWRGPLIVLVDRNAYSAAEEFAAVLQDNSAAVVMGEPTGGAGCGHMLEGEEVVLKHSGATFQMPDCTRLRADGSNEIRGIEPDVLVGFTPRDGAKLKGQRFLDKLGAAIMLTHDRLGQNIP